VYRVFQECTTGDIAPLDLMFESLLDAKRCVDNPNLAGLSWAVYDKYGKCYYARFRGEE
jgi:hypothetical protein